MFAIAMNNGNGFSLESILDFPLYRVPTAMQHYADF